MSFSLSEVPSAETTVEVFGVPEREHPDLLNFLLQNCGAIRHSEVIVARDDVEPSTLLVTFDRREAADLCRRLNGCTVVNRRIGVSRANRGTFQHGSNRLTTEVQSMESTIGTHRFPWLSYLPLGDHLLSLLSRSKSRS